jgi:hypothetical protein
VTERYDDLRSLDDWLMQQLIEHTGRGNLADDEPIPPSVRQRGEPYVHLCATLIFDLEVANGGLPQFFENTTGAIAPMVRDALEQIGLRGYASIMTQLIDALGPDYPIDYLARVERMAADSEFQEQLERGYRAIDTWSEEFIAARHDYAKAHGIIR